MSSSVGLDAVVLRNERVAFSQTLTLGLEQGILHEFASDKSALALRALLFSLRSLRQFFALFAVKSFNREER